MTYDAVLVARRGLGADELQLASPGFINAVRWAAFAERIWDGTDELMPLAEQRPAKGMSGQDLTDFMANRSAIRSEIKNRRVLLLLEDPDPPAETTHG